jgi:hypothetical protein
MRSPTNVELARRLATRIALAGPGTWRARDLNVKAIVIESIAFDPEARRALDAELKLLDYRHPRVWYELKPARIVAPEGTECSNGCGYFGPPHDVETEGWRVERVSLDTCFVSIARVTCPACRENGAAW